MAGQWSREEGGGQGASLGDVRASMWAIIGGIEEAVPVCEEAGGGLMQGEKLGED